MTDAREGFTFTWEDGRTVDIEGNPYRVFVTAWPNNVIVEVMLYPAPVPGKHFSDRIQMRIKPSEGDDHSWYMNLEDAITIIAGLSTAVQEALIKNIPIDKRQTKSIVELEALVKELQEDKDELIERLEKKTNMLHYVASRRRGRKSSHE